MSARSASPARRRGSPVLRRRAFAIVVTLVIVGALGFVIARAIERGYRELALPLRHDDIIRQQAKAKRLDPALIAAVIYQESRFRPRPSKAGAQGLMQILPGTADFIADRTGGTRFTAADLATPQINIQYGSYYLRYLLDRYDDDTLTALAAYNAGETRVDQWLAKSNKQGGLIVSADEIPFSETREYVKSVIEARAEYKREYTQELSN